MPQNIFRMTNSRLQPCQYPGDARLRNGKFGATQQFFAGQAIGRKTSDQLLYPCAAGTNDVYSVKLSGGPATAGTFTITFINASGAEVTTTALNWNDNCTTINAAIVVALGTAGCIVTQNANFTTATPFSTGTGTYPILFTFSGTGYSGLHWPAPRFAAPPPTFNPPLMTGLTGAIVATYVTPSQVQTITLATAATTGDVNLSIPIPGGSCVMTGPVAYTATLANWQTAIDNAVIAGGGAANAIVATTASSAAFPSSAVALVLTFSGALYAGQTSPLVRFNVGADVTPSYATEDVTIVDTTYTADGTQVCVGFAEYSFTTDASSLCYFTTVAGASANQLLTTGEATMGFYDKGDFLIADLIGWNPLFAQQMNGRIFGPTTAPMVHLP